MSKIITVFGSSLPQEGDYEYKLAYQIGYNLGRESFNICTGGYQGIMDAASKGAVDAGSQAVGITVDYYKSKVSKYLSKEIKTSSLFERLDKLVGIAAGYVILPGGTGTLLELSVLLEYMNKGIIQNKPVAAIGNMWDRIIEVIDERMVFENRNNGLVKLFHDADSLTSYLTSVLK